MNFLRTIFFSSIALVAVTHSAAYAVITHPGTISVDTTWDNADTHLVTGDIAITNYSTLTIQSVTIDKICSNIRRCWWWR